MRRALLLLGVISFVICRPPNFIVLLADDFGYGDLSCYGHPTIMTPNIDRMAQEGMRFTQFYSGAPVCTPARTALLTGRYPVRSGMCGDVQAVLWPDSLGGLPPEEVTIAAALKPAGYATKIVGKWHQGVGEESQYLPLNYGFDSWFGLPYSNDNGPLEIIPPNTVGFSNLPLYRNSTIIEQPVSLDTLAQRYTTEAIQFLNESIESDTPFFLYLAYDETHVFLFASEEFTNTSLRGQYGDAAQEMDWSVGQVLDFIRGSSAADNTMVWFTSDNGPAFFEEIDCLWYGQAWCDVVEVGGGRRGYSGGSAGPFCGHKADTWEGGVREPGIVWWPGTVPANVVTRGMGATMDLLPTILDAAGVPPPDDRILDGVSLMPLITGANATSPRNEFYYYDDCNLVGVRSGAYKINTEHSPEWQYVACVLHDGILPTPYEPELQLFNLNIDPGEKYPIAASTPGAQGIIDQLQALMTAFNDTVVQVPSQLTNRSLYAMPCCNHAWTPTDSCTCCLDCNTTRSDPLY